MPWQEAFTIGTQIAEALASAHEAGMIHRDIKPGNILLSPAGKAFVTDFGIAKVLGATTKLTVDGSRLGTPQYMSPERCKNKEITPASDIYSLGVLLYQSICGRLPYEANSPVELVAKITGEDPVRITEYLPDVPENVDRLLAHMLDPDPRARPQCARALLTLMERVRQGLPLDAKNTGGAAGALDNFRKQLERETSRRTPQPKTEAPQVPWGVRLSRAWFQMSRRARRAIAAGLALAMCAPLGAGAWYAARVMRPELVLQLPQADPSAWSTPVTPYTVAPESSGVSVARIALPGFVSTGVAPVIGARGAAIELRGAPGSSVAGQYALVHLSPEPASVEVVVPPAPLGDGGATLLAASMDAALRPGYALAQHTRAYTLGAGRAALPANATVAQALGGGRWAAARMLAGRWQLDVVEADGRDVMTLALPTGPVTALAVAPDGLTVAFVTGAEMTKVLWTMPLAADATATEVARGQVTLLAQAFAQDSQRFVAVLQERSTAPAEVRVYQIGGGEATGLARGSHAAFGQQGDQVVFSAADRAGRLQLWQIDVSATEPTQLTFLGAGLAGPFALASPDTAAALIANEPAAALVSLGK
jgi:hypothetical protein